MSCFPWQTSVEDKYTKQVENVVFLSLFMRHIEGGFLPVYFTSLGFILLGILYILLIPESVTRRDNYYEEDEDDETALIKNPRRNLFQFIKDTNKLFWETIKYVFRFF